MNNNEKRVVFMKGSVQFPLRIGAKAIINHSDGPTLSSVVEVIHRVSDDLIVFETLNSVYCVAVKRSPIPSSAAMQPALCA